MKRTKTDEFSKRRKRLMQMMGKGSIAILPTAPVSIRNRDVEHPYRPDSDFYYLTGFKEPDSVAVIIPKRKQGEYILFCRESDPQAEIWTGRRAGLEGVKSIHGADDAFPITDIDEILPGLLENCERVYYTMGCDPQFDQQVIGWVNQLRTKARSGVHTPGEFVALDHLLHDMRLFKSREEIKTMKQAAAVSAQAHIRAMQVCRPGMMEYEIEAEFVHHFHKNGCATAYSSIVGGGANGCILHYVDNDQPLNDGDLLLIDAGAEKDYYASDITRTFPVNGRFSREQAAVYNLVLVAQEAAIEKIKPGNHRKLPLKKSNPVITGINPMRRR
jgi:Xaa-Pro aminopeptidase